MTPRAKRSERTGGTRSQRPRHLRGIRRPQHRGEVGTGGGNGWLRQRHPLYPRMTITVLDTAGMREVLTAPPGDREDRLRRMLTPMQDMYRYFPRAVDLVPLPAAGQGYPLERRSAEVLGALEQPEAAHAWTR